jgi:hypothetical protein
MRRVFLFAIATILILAFAIPRTYGQTRSARSRKPPQKKVLQAGEIAAILNQSLVLIETRDKEGQKVALGSGFFIDQHTIITNLHVFKWAYSATAKIIKDGTRIDINQVVTLDRQHDLCTFTVYNAGTPVKIASQKPRVGDRLYTTGNPMGLEATFSSGMVTAIRADAIQMDAPISHGSSGGPVANDRGEVVGVSTASFSRGQNLNFAVPIDNISHTMDYLPVSQVGRIALTDTEFQHFEGKIRMVTVSESDYVQDQWAAAHIIATERFDKNGNITGQCTYDKTGATCIQWDRGDDTFIWRSVRHKGDHFEPSRAYDHNQAFEVELYHHPLSTELRKRNELETRYFARMVTYDAFGNSIGIRTDKGLTARISYTSPGVEEEDVQRDASGQVTDQFRFRHSFDEYGNWISKVQYVFLGQKGWQIQNKETREITYWDELN